MLINKLKITVAVPTYCRSDLLRRLFESIARQKRIPEEILVVDASPDDKSETAVQECASFTQLNIVYIRNEKGLTRQRNRAIQKSSGDIIVFLDDDVVLEDNFLKEIESAFLAHPEMVGIGGFIVNEWSKKVERWWKVRKLLGLLPGLYQEGRVLPYGLALPLSTLKPFSGLKEVEWLPGGASAWRREIFQGFRYSQFFTDYGLAEDKQFSIRVSRKHKLAIYGDARLYHLRDPGGRPNYFWLGYFHVRNHCYLLATCLPDQPRWRHWQLLWYWTFQAILSLTVGILSGYGRISLSFGVGLLWGVVTHLFYQPQESE